MIPPLIMIVNDDPQVLVLFTRLLEQAGYRTVTHPRGAGAHALVTQMQPALLILDIVMEQPDAGWQVLEELRHDPATQRLPVLISSGQWDVVARMHDRGDLRCGVLPTGARLDALLSTIEQWLPIGG